MIFPARSAVTITGTAWKAPGIFRAEILKIRNPKDNVRKKKVRLVESIHHQQNIYKPYSYPKRGGGFMSKTPTIISEIKINGVWINQDDLPAETVRNIAEETITRAMNNIGYTRVTTKQKKTA